MIRSISNKKYTYIIISLILLLICTTLVSITLGQSDVTLKETMNVIGNHLSGNVESTNHLDEIVWHIRVPRVLLALFVGAGLALCGCAMQATIQNPLADPYILGISSGAALGATFGILIGVGALGIFAGIAVSMWAFIGAIGAAFLVLKIAGRNKKLSSLKLVLVGTIINAFCNALSNLIIYYASDAQGIKSVAFWTMGSLAGAKWESIPLIVISVILSFIVLYICASKMNILMMGEENATTLGVNVKFYQYLFIIISVMVIAIIVSSCGIIGFVGLIMPHITRMLVGSDNKKVIPMATLLGALFLVLCDLLSRLLVQNAELPIGIITALIGTAIFVYILYKQERLIRG